VGTEAFFPGEEKGRREAGKFGRGFKEPEVLQAGKSAPRGLSKKNRDGGRGKAI